MIDMEIDMATWVLILFVHAGIMSNADSMALTTVSGFSSKQSCESAGQNAQNIASGTVKSARYQCVEVK